MSVNPFHDLHRNRNHTRHVRLISEGGNTISRSPGPVCIDTIQVAQTCTTESHHAHYRTTAGACSMFTLPDNSLFSIPCEHALELDNGSLPAVLRSRFEQRGLALSDSATIEVRHSGRIWFISDQGRKYSVRKLAARLTVFTDPQ
jgi:hypothetical protein